MPFRYSTFGPKGTDTVNLNVSAGSQISMVAPGHYPLHWWTYVIGYGATLHVPRDQVCSTGARLSLLGRTTTIPSISITSTQGGTRSEICSTALLTYWG